MTARVLVVEDDSAVAFLLVDTLRLEGFDVREANDGVAALDALREWVPDVMVMDLGLPKMDGWELRRRQLELPAPWNAVPVVVLTGAHLPDGAADLHAAAVIRKPFDLDDLVGQIRTLSPSAEHSP